MTLDTTDRTGFAPRREMQAQGRRATMIAQFITSLALVLSIAVAVTAVSIGIARADTLSGAAEDLHSRLAAATLFAIVLVGIGGLTALLAHSGSKPDE